MKKYFLFFAFCFVFNGCSYLIIQKSDPVPAKIGKFFARFVLAWPTLSISELAIRNSTVPTWRQSGVYASTVISQNFEFKKKKRVAVLPFLNSGKDGLDYTVADSFSTALMDMGFTVVDRAQIEAIFTELKLNMSGAISPAQLKVIGKLLSIDVIVVGTVDYSYVPSISYANIYYAGGTGAYYSLSGESMKMIDVETGEILISSICCDSGFRGSGLGTEIAKSIRNKILPKKI